HAWTDSARRGPHSLLGMGGTIDKLPTLSGPGSLALSTVLRQYLWPKRERGKLQLPLTPTQSGKALLPWYLDAGLLYPVQVTYGCRNCTIRIRPMGWT